MGEHAAVGERLRRIAGRVEERVVGAAARKRGDDQLAKPRADRVQSRAQPRGGGVAGGRDLRGALERGHPHLELRDEPGAHAAQGRIAIDALDRQLDRAVQRLVVEAG
jgi:hypothetical protein